MFDDTQQDDFERDMQEMVGGGFRPRRVPSVNYTPIPERGATLDAQMNALKANRRESVLVTPGEDKPATPQGFTETRLPEGKLIPRPGMGTAEELSSAVEDGAILGHVAPKPREGSPTATVAAFDKKGRELQTSVVPPEYVPAQAAALKRQFPQGEVQTGGDELANAVLDQRQPKRVPSPGWAAERGHGPTPVSLRMPAEKEPIEEPQQRDDFERDMRAMVGEKKKPAAKAQSSDPFKSLIDQLQQGFRSRFGRDLRLTTDVGGEGLGGIHTRLYGGRAIDIGGSDLSDEEAEWIIDSGTKLGLRVGDFRKNFKQVGGSGPHIHIDAKESDDFTLDMQALVSSPVTETPRAQWGPDAPLTRENISAMIDESVLSSRPKDWSEEEERRFRAWHESLAMKLHYDPDPDRQTNPVDFRAAFRANANPDEQGNWPTEFVRQSPGSKYKIKEQETISAGGFPDQIGPEVEGELYGAWYAAHKEGNVEDAGRLAQTYLSAFPKGQYAEAIRNEFRRGAPAANPRETVTIDLGEYVRQGDAPTADEVAKRIYNALGFTDTEAEKYAKRILAESVTDAFYGFKGGEGDTDAAMQSILERAKADPGGRVAIPGLDKLAVERTREQLSEIRKEREGEQRGYWLEYLSSLPEKSKERTARQIAKSRPLDEDERKALGAEYSLWDTYSGAVTRSAGELVSGVGKVVSLFEDEPQGPNFITQAGDYIQREGQSAVNLGKRPDVWGSLVEGTSAMAPDLAASFFLPQAKVAHLGYWMTSAGLKSQARGEELPDTLKEMAMAGLMLEANKPLAPVMNKIGEGLLERGIKGTTRVLAGAALGFGLAKAQGATDDEAISHAIQFGAMNIFSGKRGEERKLDRFTPTDDDIAVMSRPRPATDTGAARMQIRPTAEGMLEGSTIAPVRPGAQLIPPRSATETGDFRPRVKITPGAEPKPSEITPVGPGAVASGPTERRASESGPLAPRQKLAPEDAQIYQGVVEYATRGEAVTPANLQREFGIGYGKATQMIDRLKAEKVTFTTGRAPSPVTDRRADFTQRAMIGEALARVREGKATAEDHDLLHRTIFKSETVDLPNRRAYDEAPKKPVQVRTDADGLKAFNDRYGYAAGDALLNAKAEAMKRAGLEAYHEKGDEFIAQGDSEADVSARIEQARDILRNTEFEITTPTGEVKRFKGADFSYGTGSDLKAAESGLKRHKAERERSGLRKRGEFRGIVEVESPQRNQNQGDNARRQDVRKRSVDDESVVDTAAHDAASSPRNDLREPTPAQIEAGNYRKGHTKVAGLDVSIENPAGSTRSGTGADGKPWSVEMKSHYGYIRGTKGKDKDHLDIFIKPGTKPDADGPVFVIDQNKASGHFDEHKVMFGFGDEASAKHGYLENYEKGAARIRSIRRFENNSEFKEWLNSGDLTKPAERPQANIDPNEYLNISKMNLSASEKENLARTIREQVAETGSKAKERVTFDDIKREAAEIDPALLDHLKPPKKGETLNPAVRLAAKQRLKALNTESVRLREKIETDRNKLTRTELDDLQTKAAIVERDAKALLDVLIPTRSEAGRALAFERIMVDATGFDLERYIARGRQIAQRAGENLDSQRWKDTEDAIRKSVAEGQDSTAKIAEIENRLAELRESPAVQAFEAAMKEAKKAGLKPSGEIAKARARRAVADSWKAKLDKMESGARARMKERSERGPLGPEAGSAPIIEDLADIAIIGAAKLARRGIDKAVWAAEIISEVGEWVRPHLGAIFKRSYDLYSEERAAARKAADTLKVTGDDPSKFSTEEIERLLGQAAREKAKAAKARLDLARTFARLERTSKLDVIDAYRRTGMLSSIRMIVQDIGSTAFFQPMEAIASVPGAIHDIVVGSVTKRRTLTAETPASFTKSYVKGGVKALKETPSILRHGASEEQLERLELPSEVNSGSRVVDALPNITGRVRSAIDNVPFTQAYMRALANRARAQALTEMKRGKIKQSEVKARAEEIIKNPDSIDEAEALFDMGIVEAAKEDARRATFNNDNVISKAIQSARSTSPWARFFINIPLPFTRAVPNIIARGIEYTPGPGTVVYGVKLLRALYKRSLPPEAQRSMSEVFGRQAVGAGFTLLGYTLAKLGYMIGTSEQTPSERERDRAAGRKKLAVYDPVYGVWRSLEWLGPASFPLAWGANLAESNTPGEFRDSAQNLFWEGFPITRGSKELISLFNLKSEESVKSRFGRLTASFVPESGLVRDVAMATDTKEREARGFTGPIEKNIPGLRNQLPEAVDALGRPVDYSRFWAIDPFRSTTARDKSDPVIKELVRLDVGLSKPKREDGESEEDFRRRTIKTGMMLEARLRSVVLSPQYQQPPTIHDAKKWQRRAIESAQSAASEDVKRGRLPQPGDEAVILFNSTVAAESDKIITGAKEKDYYKNLTHTQRKAFEAAIREELDGAKATLAGEESAAMRLIDASGRLNEKLQDRAGVIEKAIEKAKRIR